MKGLKNAAVFAAFMAFVCSSGALALDATSFDPRNVSVEADSISGVPVGTIITWPVATNPEGWDEGKWLECNGQTISQTVYPELFALTGRNVPNLQERTAWGSSSPGQYREAGLPNITGQFDFNGVHGLFRPDNTSGAFYVPYTTQWGPYGVREYVGTGPAAMNASRCSPVYGRSATVQPAAYTVRFLIRAQP